MPQHSDMTSYWEKIHQTLIIPHPSKDSQQPGSSNSTSLLKRKFPSVNSHSYSSLFLWALFTSCDAGWCLFEV